MSLWLRAEGADRQRSETVRNAGTEHGAEGRLRGFCGTWSPRVGPGTEALGQHWIVTSSEAEHITVMGGLLNLLERTTSMTPTR